MPPNQTGRGVSRFKSNRRIQFRQLKGFVSRTTIQGIIISESIHPLDAKSPLPYSFLLHSDIYYPLATNMTSR